MAEASESGSVHPVVLYDGVCGFCNRSVQFILRRDRGGIFRFASLQSALAGQILARHGKNPSELDTMYVVLNSDGSETLLARSDAAVYVLRRLGGAYEAAAGVLELLPASVRDWSYRVIARHRYQIFGKYETCPLPDEATKARFLDA